MDHCPRTGKRYIIILCVKPHKINYFWTVIWDKALFTLYYLSSLSFQYILYFVKER